MHQAIAEIRVSVIYPGGEGNSIVIPITEDQAYSIMTASMDGKEQMISELLMTLDDSMPPDNCHPVDLTVCH